MASWPWKVAIGTIVVAQLSCLVWAFYDFRRYLQPAHLIDNLFRDLDDRIQALEIASDLDSKTKLDTKYFTTLLELCRESIDHRNRAIFHDLTQMGLERAIKRLPLIPAQTDEPSAGAMNAFEELLTSIENAVGQLGDTQRGDRVFFQDLVEHLKELLKQLDSFPKQSRVHVRRAAESLATDVLSWEQPSHLVLTQLVELSSQCAPCHENDVDEVRRRFFTLLRAIRSAKTRYLESEARDALPFITELIREVKLLPKTENRAAFIADLFDELSTLPMVYTRENQSELSELISQYNSTPQSPHSHFAVRVLEAAVHSRDVDRREIDARHILSLAMNVTEQGLNIDNSLRNPHAPLLRYLHELGRTDDYANRVALRILSWQIRRPAFWAQPSNSELVAELASLCFTAYPSTVTRLFGNAHGEAAPLIMALAGLRLEGVIQSETIRFVTKAMANGLDEFALPDIHSRETESARLPVVSARPFQLMALRALVDEVERRLAVTAIARSALPVLDDDPWWGDTDLPSLGDELQQSPYICSISLDALHNSLKRLDVVDSDSDWLRALWNQYFEALLATALSSRGLAETVSRAVTELFQRVTADPLSREWLSNGALQRMQMLIVADSELASRLTPTIDLSERLWFVARWLVEGDDRRLANPSLISQLFPELGAGFANALSLKDVSDAVNIIQSLEDVRSRIERKPANSIIDIISNFVTNESLKSEWSVAEATLYYLVSRASSERRDRFLLTLWKSLRKYHSSWSPETRRHMESSLRMVTNSLAPDFRI